MVTSEITHKTYDPGNAVYISNPIQCGRYLDFLGPDYFLDFIWNSEVRERALVFVWKKCPETKRAKELWDRHEL